MKRKGTSMLMKRLNRPCVSLPSFTITRPPPTISRSPNHRLAGWLCKSIHPPGVPSVRMIFMPLQWVRTVHGLIPDGYSLEGYFQREHHRLSTSCYGLCGTFRRLLSKSRGQSTQLSSRFKLHRHDPLFRYPQYDGNTPEAYLGMVGFQ